MIKQWWTVKLRQYNCDPSPSNIISFTLTVFWPDTYFLSFFFLCSTLVNYFLISFPMQTKMTDDPAVHVINFRSWTLTYSSSASSCFYSDGVLSKPLTGELVLTHALFIWLCLLSTRFVVNQRWNVSLLTPTWFIQWIPAWHWWH